MDTCRIIRKVVQSTMELKENKTTKTELKLIKEKVFENGISEDDRNIRYDEASNFYDETVSNMDYRGPYIVAENIASLFNDEQKSFVNILDVGAGTGLAGLELRKFGFRNIDGLEPSKGMIHKAKEKGVYRNLRCMAITKDPLDIPKGSYDAIAVAGCFGQNHIKCEALYEMIRLVKSGGYVCIATRTENLENVEEYKDRFYPLCNDLEKSGKWKKLKQELCYYQNDREGIVFCFQIC